MNRYHHGIRHSKQTSHNDVCRRDHSKPTRATYIPPEERIAVFDNDGTLWSEQPLYFQLIFALKRIQALAPTHPEWENQQPFKAALEHDMKGLAASGMEELLQLVMASHAGMTTAEFEKIGS